MGLFRSHIQKLWVVLLSAGSLLVMCSPADNITYTYDIAPIIQKNCVPCHRPNGGGPFNLLTYQDVVKKAKTIVAVTSSGYMPPWPADRHYSSFINERGLTQAEIELIGKWYKQGCKQGEGNAVAATYNDWNELGKPDMVIDIQPVKIQNDNRDRFYVLKIPYEMPAPRFVSAVQFVPGHPGYAHHMNGHYLRFTDATNPFEGKRLADLDSDSFMQQFEQLHLNNSDGSMPERIHSAVNYLPGASGIRYPKGIGGFVMSKKGAFVANDIHYGPSRKNLTDSSRLFIYFSDKPPERPTHELMLGTNGISPIVPPLQVPANKVTKHVTQVTIYNDISILTINPHMHLIGKSFKAYASKPNGDTVRLIRIPEWRFRWQYFYTFTHPVRIPKGSTIVVEAEFDNTSDNPNNPFNPPRLIGERLDRGGASMRTTDEMLQFIITYMPYQKGDESIDLSRN
jgi:hypothetical protein